MKLRAIRKHRHECPESVRPLIAESGAFVAIGSQYDVHAIAVFDGITYVQIVDDVGYPAWLPDALFEVVESSLSKDWICNLFPSNSHSELKVLIGPMFVAESDDAYQAMVELDADQVDRFWKRIESLSITSDE